MCFLISVLPLFREKNLSELKEGNLLSEFGSVATKHLSDNHIKFVFHWLSLIFLEKGSSKSSLSDIWTVDSEMRYGYISVFENDYKFSIKY